MQKKRTDDNGYFVQQHRIETQMGHSLDTGEWELDVSYGIGLLFSIGPSSETLLSRTSPKPQRIGGLRKHLTRRIVDGLLFLLPCPPYTSKWCPDDSKGERKSASEIYPALPGDPDFIITRVHSVHDQTMHANGGIVSSWPLGMLGWEKQGKELPVESAVGTIFMSHRLLLQRTPLRWFHRHCLNQILRSSLV